jgi:hypothetical protein
VVGDDAASALSFFGVVVEVWALAALGLVAAALAVVAVGLAPYCVAAAAGEAGAEQ